MAETIKIGGEIESTATGNKVADVANIKDKTKGNKSQAQINAELETALEERYTKSETYNKTQLDNMITTPEIAYKDYDTYADMVAETVHPAGAIYRVANYDGTQAVTNKYAEYSWDGTQYKLMAVRDHGIDDVPTAGSSNLVKSGGVQNELALGAVYDVSAKNPTAGPNNDGKFESLFALLSDANLNTLIPVSVRKGGMSIKFVLSSDNKYVQYRLMSDTFNTTVANWQGVDAKVKPGSKNLIESGALSPIFVSTPTPNYTDDISELYIVGVEDDVAVGSYNNKAILTNSSQTFYAHNIERINKNDTVYELQVYSTTDSENYPIGKTVGYIVLKDYESFLYKSSSISVRTNLVISEKVKDIHNWPLIADYFVRNEITDVASDLDNLAGDVDDVKDDVAENKKYIEIFNTPAITTAYQLANDLDWFTGNYGSVNIGQYTKIMISDVYFNKIRINKIRITDDDDKRVDYKAYITNVGIEQSRECPVGEITENTHTLIASGILTVSTTEDDYIISFDKVQKCPKDYQVVVYMSSMSYSNKKIKMTGVTAGAGNPAETSNVACFNSSNPWTSSWRAGSIRDNTDGYFNVALTLLYQSPFFMKEAADDLKEQIESDIAEDTEEIIKEKISNGLSIVIPDVVYAIVGTELNIWYDTVARSSDQGLASPTNYSVMFICNKGLITNRCFRFTPTASDIGNVSCTAYLYNIVGELIESKTFTIKVVSKSALATQKRIVYFGDSLGDSSAKKLYNNFHDASKFEGTAPIMLGTNGSAPYYEAVGGYGWADYATAGQTGYRISVSGVTSMAEGAVYSDSNSHQFQVIEINITDGSGNCLLKPYSSHTGALVVPSGTLTKVAGGGDDSVAYTDAYTEKVNPLWNESLSRLDIDTYKQKLIEKGELSSLSDKIDAVAFQLGINDSNLADNLTRLHTYISDLYNLFVNDNANCKFIIGLITSPGNDLNGAGASNGATRNWHAYLENIYKLRKYYISLLTEFPNMRIATPNLNLDRYYGYRFSTRQISSSYTENEQYHNNYVHPGGSGYTQIGDAYFAAFNAILSE